MDIRFLGHACFELIEGDTRVLVDPFLTGNPKAAVEASEVEPTHVFLTHGHADHIGDTVDIAKRSGAPVVAIVELAQEIGEEDVEVMDPNLGGTVKFDWGWVKLVPAWHTGSTPKGTYHHPAGLLVEFAGKLVYHVGDTALFSDMQLLGEMYRPELAFLPIGDLFTMDPPQAARACRFLGVRKVIPIHWGTFPALTGTPEQLVKALGDNGTSCEVVALKPGESY